jgi:hypothetical protein
MMLLAMPEATTHLLLLLTLLMLPCRWCLCCYAAAAALAAQMLPHLVHELVDDDGVLSEVAGAVTKLGMLMYRRRQLPYFTDRDLVAIDKQITRMDTLLRKAFPFMNFDTPKYHNLSQFVDNVRRFGHPQNYNSDIFECDHGWIKVIYR